MTSPDPFGTPQKPFAGGTGPTLRCIGARTVIIVPKVIHRGERNPFYKPDEEETYNNTPTRDRMICDLILVDGPPFLYGGNDKDIPDTQGPYPVPGVIVDYEIDRPAIIGSINPLDVGGGGVLGRLHKVKTTKGNYAWNFGERPAAGTPEHQQAVIQLERYRQGALPQHVPTAPVANPMQPAFSVPQGNGQPPVQVPYQNQFGQGQYPGQVPPAAPQWPAQSPAQPMQPVSAPVAPQAPAPVPDWTLNPPGGMPPMLAPWASQWPTMTAAAREQMLNQCGVFNPTPISAPSVGFPMAAPTGY